MPNQTAANQSRQRIAEWESYQIAVEAVQMERDFFTLRKAYKQLSPEGADKAFFETFEKAYQNKYYTLTLPNQKAAILIENFIKKYPIQPHIAPVKGYARGEEGSWNNFEYEDTGVRNRWSGEMRPHFRSNGKIGWVAEILSDYDEFRNEQELPIPMSDKILTFYAYDSQIEMETHELNRVVNFFEMLDDGFKVETSGLRGLLSISPELRESYQNAQMQDTDWLKIEAERRNLRLQIIAKNLSDSKSETTGKAARKNTNLADYFFTKYSSKKDQMLEDIKNSATGRELLKTARERIAEGLTQNDDLREYFRSQLRNYQLKHESGAKEFCKLLDEPEIAKQLVKMFYGDSLQFKTPQKITGKYLEIAENIAQNLAQNESLIASFEHSDSQSTRITSDKLVNEEALKYIKSDFDFFKMYSDDKEFKQDFLETVFVMAEEIMGNRQTLEQVIDQYDLDAAKTKEMVKLSFTEQNGERFQKEVQNLLKKQPSILLRKNTLGRVWSSLKPFLYNQGEAVETTTGVTSTPNNPTLQALEAKFGQKLALELVKVVLDTRKDDWRNNKYKQKNVRTGLSEFVQKNNLSDTVEAEAYDIIFKHNDY